MIGGKYCNTAKLGDGGMKSHSTQRLKSIAVAATTPASSDAVQYATTRWRAAAVSTIEPKTVRLRASAGLPVSRKTGKKYGSAPKPVSP